MEASGEDVAALVTEFTQRATGGAAGKASSSVAGEKPKPKKRGGRLQSGWAKNVKGEKR